MLRHYFETAKTKTLEIYYLLKEKIISLYNKNKRNFLIVFIVLASFLLLIIVKAVFFSNKKIKAPESELFMVKVQKVRKENYTENYTVMGTIKGAIENELRFEIDGVLSSYNFSEGAHIRRGQIICSLNPKDAFTKSDFARSKYSSEKSSYFSASQKLKVYEELFSMKALSESKLQEAIYETQSAEAKMKAALSELELAQSNLAKTNLIATSDGLLAEILIKPGEYITQQDVIAKYISGGETNFEVDVPEKDVKSLKIGQRVKINCDSYPDKDFIGQVKEIAPTVKERTRTTIVKIGVEKTENLLRSGMFGRGTIYLAELQDVILVPNGSIVSLGQTAFLVPIVKPDPKIPGEGIIEMRTVVVGTKLSQSTVIDDGLYLNELVVIETQGQLSDGVKVKFTEVAQTKPSQTTADNQ